MHLLPRMIFSACLALAAQTSVAGDYTFYAPNNPPWGDKTDGSGFVIETATTALDRAGLSYDIVYVPWKRAQHQVAQQKNGFMGPLTRLIHREHRYQWVAPINKSFLQLVTPQVALANERWEDMRTIPVVARRESPAEFMLVDLNFEAVTIVENEIIAARMVAAKRVLLWMQRGLPGNWAYHYIGEDSADLNVIVRWDTPLQYLVASPNIEAETIEKIALILENMRSTGEIDAIKERHLPFPISCELRFTCKTSMVAPPNPSTSIE